MQMRCSISRRIENGVSRHLRFRIGLETEDVPDGLDDANCEDAFMKTKLEGGGRLYDPDLRIERVHRATLTTTMVLAATLIVVVAMISIDLFQSETDLDATWEFTITFDPDEGKWADETSEKLVKYYSSGEEIEPTSIGLPEKIGYGSVGWFCNGKTYIAGDKVVVTSDMTFTPNWQINCETSYTTFDPNGGEWADGTSQILKVEFKGASCRVTFVGTSQIQITILGQKTEQRSVENPTKSGFEFIGWCSGEGIMYTGGMETDYCWDRSFKAVWKEKAEEFTVTFDPNGGNWSGSTEPQEYPIASGNAIELADVAPPTRDSYTFGGWSFNGKTYSAGEKVTVQSNMTFKAEWTESGESEPDVPVDPVTPIIPIAPFITVDGQETIEVLIGENEDTGNKTDTRTILLIAVVATIIAELAVLSISKRR